MILLLNLHSLARRVTALGPGRRLVLWLAGCPLRCKGCITPQLWSPQSGAGVATRELAPYLLSLPDDVDGITLTGGEPFVQARAAADLLALLKTRRPWWNVLVFSGYPLAYIRKNVADAGYLLRYTDLLIDGPYGQKQPAQQPLLASKNQVMHVLSPSGERMKKDMQQNPQARLNLGLGDNQTWLIGIVDEAARVRVHRGLGLGLAPDLGLVEELGRESGGVC